MPLSPTDINLDRHDSLWSVDLFRCESIGPVFRLLKSHWVMVVMHQYTRKIIGFGVHAGNVDGPALCQRHGRGPMVVPYYSTILPSTAVR